MKPPGSAPNAPRPLAAVATRSSTSGEGHHLKGRDDEFGTPKNREDHHQTIGMKDGHHAKNGWCI